MIRSMTGYGRAQEEKNNMMVTVELKSVNHRYFEFNARVPRAYGFLEEKLKSFVNSRVSRGKIECYVSVEALDDGSAEVLVNHSLAGAYVAALKEIEARYDIGGEISASTISRYPDVLVVRKSEADEDLVWATVKEVAQKAVERFIEMRCAEGERLKADIQSRGNMILDCVAFVEERSPQTVKEYNEKLLSRLKEVLEDVTVDEQRILTEAAIYADKIAVAEETVRLRSHIDQLNQFLNADEAVGRKIDFLIQEINREANTIGSKANDMEIARKVVDMKAEVEKIREQVQNIE